MFNSYDKDKFVVGKEYYTYYMDLTNKENKLKDYTGIMKVLVLSNDPTEYSPDGCTKFSILESKKLGKTISHNIHYYMNGYGLASTNFYESKEECEKAHDKQLKEWSRGLSIEDRTAMLSKLVNKIAGNNLTKKERIAMKWYEGLNRQEKIWFDIVADLKQ